MPIQQRLTTWTALSPRGLFVATAVAAALIYSTQSGDLARTLLDVASITGIPYARAALASISDIIVMIALVSLASQRSPASVSTLAGVFAPPWRALLWGLVVLTPAVIASLALATPAADVSAADIAWKGFGGPLAEEVVYRGLAIGVLVRLCGWSMWPACLLPALAFGAVHAAQGSDLGGAAGVVAITGLGGLLFGWVFVRWGFNLWPPVILHVGLNTLWLLFAFGDTALGGWLGNGVRFGVVLIAILATLWLSPSAPRTADPPQAA
jgi:membrane protease YdiL (CAAX protease family)